MNNSLFINECKYYNDIIDLNNNQLKIKFILNNDTYKINNIKTKILSNNYIKSSLLFKLNNENIIENKLNILSSNENIFLLQISSGVNNLYNIFYILYYVLQCYSIINNNESFTNQINNILNKNYICTYKNINYNIIDAKNNVITKNILSNVQLFDKNIINDLYNFINIDLKIYIKYILYHNKTDNNINKFINQYCNKINILNINCLKNDNLLNNTEYIVNKNNSLNNTEYIVNKNNSIINKNNNDIIINKNNSIINKNNNDNINEIITKFDYYSNLLKQKIIELQNK